MSETCIPDVRVRVCNDAPVRAAGEYVLYWMVAFRRAAWNFSLDRAVEWAEKLRRPLVVLEALRCDYPWASDRMHAFVLQGMHDNTRRFAAHGVLFYPYVERARGEGKGLLRAASENACVVVTDDFPCFFIPDMLSAAAKQVPVRMEAIDSNGLLPLRAADHDFPTAYAFRRFLQKNLPEHLVQFPQSNPLKDARFARRARLPGNLTAKWPATPPKQLENPGSLLAKLPIDHKVGSTSACGGASAAQSLVKYFAQEKLGGYAEGRNQPDEHGASGLSPYLHFGHISAHEIFSTITKRERWSPDHIALRANGSRAGWWGMGTAADAFLDQLVTWRELGFNFCAHREDYDQFGALPKWALATLRKHARDERESVYSLDVFERAATHDPLWNAAQTQLVREGRIHNYLRMLWGKKILEWTESPAKALDIMIELNNKYALDGRDPNSYSGIFWCLGRYDRPWGPKRPVFGTVRYMSSANTARKLHVKEYLRRYSPSDEPSAAPADSRAKRSHPGAR